MTLPMYDQLRTLADLEQLIASGAREGETLEFKRATRPIEGDELVKVAISVSAFANANGGTILYGVAPHEKDTSRAGAIEPIAAVNVERIQQAIATHIRRPILGIRTRVLERDGQPAVLVVDVPASPDAPHQVLKEHRYYRRHGVRKEPMPHDLVELYFGRRLGPRVELGYKVDTTNEVLITGLSSRIIFTVNAFNVGPRSAEHLMLQITMPQGGWCRQIDREPNSVTAEDRNGARTSTLYHANKVLHPELSLEMRVHFVVADEALQQGALTIQTAAYADGMRPVRHAVTMQRVASGDILLHVENRPGPVG